MATERMPLSPLPTNTAIMRVENDPDTKVQSQAVDDATMEDSSPQPAQPENIKVFLRIRPLSEVERQENPTECINKADETSILYSAKGFSAAESPREPTNESNEERYMFDKVFEPSTTQQELFKQAGAPLVKALFAGNSSLIFAYGITNAGKTFTIEGTDTHPGILPRIIERVFRTLRKSTAKLTDEQGEENLESIGCNDDDEIEAVELDPAAEYVISVSFLEIYKENIYDLLSDTQVKARKPLLLQEDKYGRMTTKGLRDVEVTTIAEAQSLHKQGRSNRQVARTLLNHDSSRSHSVFSLKLIKRTMGVTTAPAAGGLLHAIKKTQVLSEQEIGKLSIVDLAGSERITRTHNTGERLAEASNINQSLTVLGRCLQDMRWNQSNPTKKARVVPFRESKITRLFQDSLCKGRAVMIVNVSPRVVDAEETVFALRYAAVARSITTGSKVDSWRPKKALPRQEIKTWEVDVATEDPHDQVQLLRQRLLEYEERQITLEAALRAELVDVLNNHTTELEAHYHQRLELELINCVNKYERRMAALNAIIALQQQEREQLQARLEKASSQAESVVTDGISTDASSDSEALQSLRAKLLSAEQRCQQLESELSTLQSNSAKQLAAAQDTHSKEVRDLKIQAADSALHKKQHDMFRGMYEKLNTEFLNLQKEHAKALQMVSKSSADSESKKALRAVEQKLARAEEERTKLESEKKRLENECKQSEALVEQRSQTIVNLQKQLAVQASEKEKLQATIDQLKSRVEEMAQLNTLNKGVSVLVTPVKQPQQTTAVSTPTRPTPTKSITAKLRNFMSPLKTKQMINSKHKEMPATPNSKTSKPATTVTNPKKRTSSAMAAPTRKATVDNTDDDDDDDDDESEISCHTEVSKSGKSKSGNSTEPQPKKRRLMSVNNKKKQMESSDDESESDDATNDSDNDSNGSESESEKKKKSNRRTTNNTAVAAKQSKTDKPPLVKSSKHTKESLNVYTVRELRDFCKEHGLKIKGKGIKKDVIKLILDFCANEPDDSDHEPTPASKPAPASGKPPMMGKPPTGNSGRPPLPLVGSSTTTNTTSSNNDDDSPTTVAAVSMQPPKRLSTTLIRTRAGRMSNAAKSSIAVSLDRQFESDAVKPPANTTPSKTVVRQRSRRTLTKM